MKLIVGLGNPGSKYELTRHNIGFLVIDQLADELKIDLTKTKYNAALGQGSIDGEKVILAKPQTFMNLSGEAVGPIANFYKIDKKDILVIYDDLDLDVGRLRFRGKGGAGGHNGIKSLLAHLGGEEFARLKVGIGRPPEGWQTADYVLSRFTEEEWKDIINTVEKATSGCIAWAKSGIIQAMNEFN